MSTAASTEDLLHVHGLHVAYESRGRSHVAVEDLSFAVPKASTLALVGQSGSGKTTVANAVLRLLPAAAVKKAGSIVFDGRDIAALDNREFRALRGRRIGYVPQDPQNSLNPVRRIGSQVAESIRVATGTKVAEASVHEVISRVGIPDARRVAKLYPHELSGGMLQRVLIGMAIAAGPELIVADEPTSALDVTVQRHILDLFDELKKDLGIGILLITHDLAIAADRADRLVALHEGRMAEAGTATAVLRRPEAAYTRRLVADVPALSPDKYAAAKAQRTTDDGRADAIRVERLVRVFGSGASQVTAVDDVSFEVPCGTTHALVGESGSGKSTTARVIVRLDRQTSGAVFIDGAEVTSGDRASLIRLRRNLQFVYQNPFTSLDPRYTVRRLIEEPLLRYRIGSRASRRERARDLLAQVGMRDEHLDAVPGTLSGGQRQRVAIARALSLDPRTLILDEPTSALDVSVQAQILDLLVRLQHERGLTYLFVSHDLSIVRQFADTVTVLRAGRVVDDGPVARVFEAPADAYTRELIEAIPAFHASTEPAEAALPDRI